MQPHEERVIQEKFELEKNVVALGHFISKGKPDNISDEVWNLLSEQSFVMHKYLTILNKRIELFK